MAVNTRAFAEERGSTTAMVDEFRTLSYEEADDRINRTIHGLRGLGLQPQDTVGMLSGNRSEFTTAWTATQHAEWGIVPVNWHFSPEEVAYILRDSGSRGLLADGEYAELAHEAAEMAGCDIRVMWGGEADGFVGFEDMLSASSGDEPADQSSGIFLFYTSGTTGHPKGVLGSTSAFGGDPAEDQARLEAFLDLVGIAAPDGTVLANAPLYHAGPIGFSLAPAAGGASIVFRRNWDAEETLRLIDEHRVTNVYAVPTHFNRLLALPQEVRDAFDGSSIRTVFHTAAPCPPSVKRRMIDWWGPVINELYGASEGGLGNCTTVTSEEWLAHPGTVGKASPITEVFIAGEDGRRLGPDEPGTIYFKSLLDIDFEYREDPDKTAAAHHPDGGFTVGDVGYLDEEGYLYLSDRQVDMIISGGVNIYPAEIEACLIDHPAVADVAVIGVPNEEYGEEVKALVQPADDGAPGTELTAELKRHCRQHLAGFQVPRSVEYMELPRTPTGKLSKRSLRAPYWEGTGRLI